MTPRIVCLCGSTRFGEAFDAASLSETLAGRIVMGVGSHRHSDQELGLTTEQKSALDELHLRKIDLADEVLVINVDGYMGASTSAEVRYARTLGKPVRFLIPPRRSGERAIDVGARSLEG